VPRGFILETVAVALLHTPHPEAIMRRSVSKRSGWVVAAAALLLAILPILPHPGIHASSLEAQQRDIAVERFDALYEVAPDGSFTVTETLDVRFEGSWNGFERDIFRDHVTAEGRRARVRISMESITDADGNPLEVEEEGINRGHRYRIWVPGAQDATRRVVLRYRVRGGLRFFAEDAEEGYHDELYWNVTGQGWEMPIESARARVVLPPEAEGLQAWGYTGREGATEEAVVVRIQGSEAEVETTRVLREREGLTISATWEPGVIDRPGAVSRFMSRIRDIWPAGLPALALFGMFVTWRRKGKDPARRAVVVQYEPPEDLSPAEVGTLVDHKAELHDITATLVDLAVRGYLSIEEEEKKGFLGIGSSSEFTFHREKPASQWAGLRPHERKYLEGLFPAKGDSASLGEGLKKLFAVVSGKKDPEEAFGGLGDDPTGDPVDDPVADSDTARPRSVKLSDLENKFYKHMEKIRKAIYDRLKASGYYDEHPTKAKGRWAGIGMMAIFAGVFLGFMAADPPGLFLMVAPEPLPLGVGLGLSGLIILIFSAFMGVRTEAGVRALEASLGFKEFLERVESDRYKRMITSPKLFEEYLPYAMAFQVEDRWSSAFDDLYKEPPDWYRGSAVRSGAFSASAFSKQMRTLSTSASKTMSSSPGGSSGSGGGGSAGGGSGGGGGRGF